MKLFIHSYTWTVPPLKFRNGWVISSPKNYWACDYLSMLGLKLIHVSKMGLNRLRLIRNQTTTVALSLFAIHLAARRHINSLAPGGYDSHFKSIIFRIILQNRSWVLCRQIILRIMPLDLTNVKSTLAPVMAWYRQATSHYQSPCWPRSV